MFTHLILTHEAGPSVAVRLRRLALKLLAPLRSGSGSNHMGDSCQLLTEGCWFTPRNHLFQLLKLTTIYNQIRLINGVTHQFPITITTCITNTGTTTLPLDIYYNLSETTSYQVRIVFPTIIKHRHPLQVFIC